MELTVGSKFEENDYTGFEYQPNVRYLWSIDDRHAFWASVARAVRTPARLNTDINLFAPITDTPLPIYVNVTGNSDFDAEDVLAREAGYRITFNQNLTLDLAVFSNEYDKLQTQEAGTPFVEPGPPSYLTIPAQMGNGMEGETYGGTLAALWQPLERWRLGLHWSRLEMDLSLKPGSLDTGALNIAGNSPERQVGVNSNVTFANGLSL
jgi:iron complex outermembrane receptor protein